MESVPEAKPAKALFISRAGADADFAAVIGVILKGAGYSVILQQWDFTNRNFMERMHAALAEGARVVALLSPEYLRSDHCQAEWQNTIAGDPLNTKSRLILLRVAECEPAGLLSGLAYWDLVLLRDNRPLLEDIVRDAVREDRCEAVPTGPYWRTPRTILDAEAIRAVPSFSGREEALVALSAALSDVATIAAVHGLGGVGKSSVAREYAWRNREQYSVIWWLNAQTEDGIIDGLLRLGTLFVRGLDQLQDRRAAAQQVTGSVLNGFAKPVLLIFDNLEDERLLRTWGPRMGSRSLVTSRNAAWSADITAIPLHTWSLDVAIGYLRRESGRADLIEADARAIVEALGGLPLALAHAAASLRGMRMVTPGRYLERISEHLKDAPRGVEYPRSVFATFSTAIAQAEEEAVGAVAVLCFAASFAPDAIPDELFRQAIDRCPAGLQPIVSEGGATLDLRSALTEDPRLDEALGALDRLSLLDFAEASRTYTIHRLVQLAARDLAGDATREWIEFAITIANRVFPEVQFAAWAQCERLLPHALAALNALPPDAMVEPAADLALRCAVYLRERGAYPEAESLAARALTIREDVLDSEHSEVAQNLNELAVVYVYQGRCSDAERLFARALAIREKTFGPEHPVVAETLNDLGTTYADQGRYSEAESLHARTLAIREKALGPEHPAVAESLNNLASAYQYQGRYSEAEPIYIRALSVTVGAFGPEHPNVALNLNNLAVLYLDQGRYSDAEPRHARALAIREKALGPEHPNVAFSLGNLASVYVRQGRYSEAEPLQARALAIREKALGPEHPDVARSLNDLAAVYVYQGRYSEAEPLHARALAILEKAFGPGHPALATNLKHLAVAFEHQGRDDEAEGLYVRALAISERALGAEHPTTKGTNARLVTLRSRRSSA